jgi:hypothetical protein
VLTQQLQEPITESAQEDQIQSTESNKEVETKQLNIYNHLYTFYYRESVLKGENVFAKNVQKSAYVISSNDAPS